MTFLGCYSSTTLGHEGVIGHAEHAVPLPGPPHMTEVILNLKIQHFRPVGMDWNVATMGNHKDKPDLAMTVPDKNNQPRISRIQRVYRTDHKTSGFAWQGWNLHQKEGPHQPISLTAPTANTQEKKKHPHSESKPNPQAVAIANYVS